MDRAFEGARLEAPHPGGGLQGTWRGRAPERLAVVTVERPAVELGFAPAERETQLRGVTRRGGNTLSQLRIAIGPEDHVDGPMDAPISLVEYGDYKCPYCAKAYSSVKQVKEAVGERLCFVFRNFPLTHLHPEALQAAEAAEAAGELGRFWEMYGLLYENQRELELPALVGYAGELGLDVARFERDVVEHRFLERLRREVRGGERSGAKGTPSFFLNGRRYEGDYSPDGLLAAIKGGPAAYGG